MKGFIIFALLIAGVYSAQLKEIRLNIKGDDRCDGRNLKIRITQGDDACETTSSGRFEHGRTLVWETSAFPSNPTIDVWLNRPLKLGHCSDFDVDEDAEFNLVYNGDGQYCPTLIEFLTARNGSNSLDSFKSKLDQGGHWFSSVDNDRSFEPLSNSEFIARRDRIQCPEQQGCPVNQLHAYKPLGRDRKQCTFECPRIQRMEGRNIGQACHEVTYEVDQYEYCCQSNSTETGFDRCQDVHQNRGINDGQNGDEPNRDGHNGDGQNVNGECPGGNCQGGNGRVENVSQEESAEFDGFF